MSIERTIYCDGPNCGDHPDDPGHPDPMPCHVRTATPPPYLPIGIIETREQLHGEDTLHHFCSWDCCMKFAAQQPIPERIDWDDTGELS